MSGVTARGWFRALQVVAVVAACAWLGWLIVANTMADTETGSDPAAALWWRPTNSAALVGVAEDRLRTENPGGAPTAIEQLAAQALSADPLEERALRALAFAAEIRGDDAGAAAIMQAVGKRTRRNTPAQIWLFNRNLADGRFNDALANADALLRTRPDLRDDLAPVLLSLTDDDRSRRALLEVLATDPPWRPWYLSALARQDGGKPATVFDIYAALQDSARPPTNAEVGSFLDQLVAGGQYELAYVTWLRFLPLESGQQLDYAYNGDFERPLSGLPLDWVIGGVRGATTEVVEVPPEGDRVLRVEFANTRVRYRHVGKLLLLPPGRYRLSGSERAEKLENKRGLVWRLSCADNEQQILGESDRLSGTTPWRPFTVTFEVPQSGCRAQWLRLHLAARVALEEEVGGEVFYDDLTVEREGVGQ